LGGEKLEKTNNFAQFFFNNADVIMVILDRNGTVIDANKKTADTLGYTQDMLKGKNWFESIVPQGNREEAKRLFQNLLSGSLRHFHSEHSVITKQGLELTLNYHNILVSDGKGKTIGVLSSADDVTSRKKVEKLTKGLENRLQVSLDHMIEGCQIIDYDWRYVYVNEAAAKQGRKTKEGLLGYTMMQAYPGIDKTELFSHLRNCMVNRLAYQMENEFTFPNGPTGWFELHIEPVPEGLVILSIDITNNKKAESELRNYRSRLEQVVAQRTAEHAQTNEELTRKKDELQKTKDALNLRSLILDNSKEAIFLANTKGDFLYANNAATKTYGYDLDAFLNMNISILLQKTDTPSVKLLLKRIVESGGATLEMIHVRKDKNPMPVKVDSNLVVTTHGQFIVFVVRRLNYRT
jgi:PAS domain S-box-containing protein